MKLPHRTETILLAAMGCALLALGAMLLVAAGARLPLSVDLMAAGGGFLVLCCGFLLWALIRRRAEGRDVTEQLHNLSAASAEIFTLVGREQLLSRAAHVACELIGGRAAIASLRSDGSGPGLRRMSDGGAPLETELPDDATIEALLTEKNGAFRLRPRDAAGCIALQGRTLPASLAAAPLVDHDGRRIGFISLLHREKREFSAHDLAVLRQLAQMTASAAEILQVIESRTIAVAAARAAQEGAERARIEIARIFDSMSDAFCAIDRETRFTYVNAQCEAILNRSKEELLGKTLVEAFPHVGNDPIQHAFARALHQREQVDVEYYSPIYERWFELRMFPHDQGIAVYFRDITARIQTQETLRQAQKMEMVGQLTGGLAHDFNNLLTVILGNLDTLHLALQDKPALLELVKTAEQAGDRAAELISRLLAFARRQALDPQKVDVNALIFGFEGLLRHAIGDLIRYSFTGAPDLPPALIDPSQLESAILNLVINARDAMPEGGRLDIETRIARIDGGAVDRPPDVRSGEYVKVTVSDTGHGMPPEVAARAFEPFFTTKPVGKGSGLGLSMIFGFVKQSGGHVQLESEPGRGTSVSLYLPLAAAHAGGSGLSLTEQTDAPTGTGGSILLADTDQLAGPFAEATLLALGYEVTAVTSGGEVLDLLDQGGRYDLLITDLELDGDPTGIELARLARERRPGLPVIYLARSGEHHLASQARLDPGATLLRKPFRRVELAHRVEAVISAGREKASNSFTPKS